MSRDNLTVDGALANLVKGRGVRLVFEYDESVDAVVVEATSYRKEVWTPEEKWRMRLMLSAKELETGRSDMGLHGALKRMIVEMPYGSTPQPIDQKLAPDAH